MSQSETKKVYKTLNENDISDKVNKNSNEIFYSNFFNYSFLRA